MGQIGGDFLAVCDFGKIVKKKLVDIDQEQNWLIDEVRAKTGLYFDSGYLHKILTGRISTPKIVAAICEILDILNPASGREEE